MIKTDILIIGGGPAGLFSVFEAGLFKMKCHILDSLAQPGGQCIELYPKKPIYDIPAYPEIIAGDLIKKLLEQIKPFNPGYTLGETAVKLKKNNEGSFIVTTDKGTKHESKIIAIIKDDEIVSNSKKGEKVNLIFEETPFYAESGGQIGDKGIAENESCLIDILDTQKSEGGLVVHSGIVKDGNLQNADKFKLSVDKRTRETISAHHTATHILHSCLRDILGTHVRQAGSLVESNRLRFDFSHFSNIDQEALFEIESLCNERIRSTSLVEVRDNVNYEKAIKSYQAVQKIYPSIRAAKVMIPQLQELIKKEAI